MGNGLRHANDAMHEELPDLLRGKNIVCAWYHGCSLGRWRGDVNLRTRRREV
jgi:hypothetical protein